MTRKLLDSLPKVFVKVDDQTVQVDIDLQAMVFDIQNYPDDNFAVE